MVKLSSALAWVVLVAVSAASAALDQRELIERALDEPTQINLEDVKLGNAFAKVTEQTGVEVVMSPEVMSLIPYGAETTINARIEGTTLRQGLADLVGRLGMTFVVTDRFVEIIPKEAILCLDRPATWAELDTVYELSRLQPGTVRDELTSLREKMQFQVPGPQSWDILSAVIRETGAGPGDDVLSIACAKLGWAWCVSGEHIVVMTAEQKVRRQLQARIELQARSRPLVEVLQELSRRARVKIRLEPGALEGMSAAVRDGLSLTVRYQTVEETLDSLAAAAGLGWLVDAEGVLLYRTSLAAPTTATGGSGSGSSDPVVGMIEIPLGGGRSMHWIVRQSDLPPEAGERRKLEISIALSDLLQGKAEGGE